MFREMRRKEREISGQQTQTILIEAEYGTLGTMNEDGFPYTTPVSFIFFDECIYFHSAKEGQKISNIVREPRVCFSVVTHAQIKPNEFTTKYKSAIVYGNAQTVDGVEKHIALVKMIEKYSPQFLEDGKKYIAQTGRDTVIVRIRPEHMTGKANV